MRGIAVISVLLFHAGLPAFQGGFVGVDVFFVISGFLITSLILKDASSGRFSISGFFSRRIRRIFPALFAVVLFSTAAGYILLPPSDYSNFGTSQIYAALFSANIHFWRLSLNYFAEGRPYPLLHIWSLGVEEQFYIAIPFVYIFIANHAANRMKAVVISAFLASLAAFCIGMPNARTTAFYLAPFRAWEFLLGAMIAGRIFPSPTGRASTEALSLSGLLLIFAASAGEIKTPIASMARIWAAVAGTALVIWAGIGQSPLVNRLLASSRLPEVGLISYSLYLWHWPMLVFASALSGRPNTPREALLVLAGALPLSYLSWRFVERPFRSYPEPGAPDSAFRIAGLVTLGTLVSGFSLRAAKGIPDRFSAHTLAIFEDYGVPLRLSALEDAEKLDFPRLGGTSRTAPTFLVWGDSHAASAAPAFESLSQRYGRAGLLAAYSSCPPIIDYRGVLDSYFPGSPCNKFNSAVIRLLRKESIKDVVLVAHWFGHRTGEEGFRSALQTTIREVRSTGARLWVLEETPGSPFHPQIRAIRLPRTEDFQAWFSFSRSEHDLRATDLRETLAAIGGNPGVRLLDPSPQFCDAAECHVAGASKLLYRDRHHLNVAGALRLVSVLEPVFTGR